jgi:hypothetical protein
LDNQTNYEIDTTPKELAYEGYRNYTYSLWFALGEFVDNSITSAYQNWEELVQVDGSDFKLRVQITIDQAKQEIIVEDNAAGISPSDFSRVLVAGERPANQDLLSVYGKGMKIAAFWWGRRLELDTTTVGAGVKSSAVMDIDVMKANGNANAQIGQGSNSNHKHGTRIRLRKPYENRFPDGKTLKSLNLLLRSMYRTYTNNKSMPVQIFLNGEEMTFQAFPLLEAPFWPNTQGPKEGSAIKVWRRSNFKFQTKNGKQITGWYGILAEMKRDLSGFFLHYKGKGMEGIGYADSDMLEDGDSLASVRDSKQYYRPPEIFGQDGSYRFGRFTGEFDISDFGKTQSTDSVKWSREEEMEFIEALLLDIKSGDEPFWKMAEKFQPRTAMRLARGNSDELNVNSKEVKSINDVLFSGWTGTQYFHDKEDEVTDSVGGRPSLVDLDPEQISASDQVVVADGEGHEHQITLEIFADPNLDLFSFGTSDGDSYTLRLNSGHPLLRRFQWGNRQVREAGLSLTLLMALPEIFLPPLVRKTSYKEKINRLARELAAESGSDD